MADLLTQACPTAVGGAAAASPFWVTTGQAGGANQPVLNATPAPRFNSQASHSLTWFQ